MNVRLGHSARIGLLFAFILFAAALSPMAGRSAPYAAFVMDARTGEVIHSRNADTRLHPASLTKMMTLYIAFQAIQRGEITLDTEIRIPALAANEPPSRLGLREGQVIRLRYLLRAAAVKSANDAATAVGLALAGSEEAFAERMNATAAAMGMSNTTFRNAHGLTQEGHMSTARDMSVLGRHLIYDFPQYYNLFSRRVADAGIAEVRNTNSRFLDNYPGADGIKTGFTNAAGYNLTASAERGSVRIIATVFGGTSTANRNARVSELLDIGFAHAAEGVEVRPPDAPAYATNGDPAVAVAAAVAAVDPTPPGAAGRVIRVTGQVQTSLRPQARPGTGPATDDVLVAAVSDDEIANILAEALQISAPVPAEAEGEAVAFADLSPQPEVDPQAPMDPDIPAEIIMTAADIAPVEEVLSAEEFEVVTRLSTSGGRNWGINVGRFNSRGSAERALLQVALNETETLEGALRRIVQRSGGFDANFMGLTRDGADLACRRLQARNMQCFMIGTE